LYISPEQQYKNKLKLNLNQDSQYKILTEGFYEMRMNWNNFDNSSIYSPHFKIGGYIW